MPTKIENLETRIAELEGWLKFNKAEHLSVACIQTDLRKAKEELAKLQSDLAHELMKFEIMYANFKRPENEGK
jgi:hypothetical protein